MRLLPVPPSKDLEHAVVAVLQGQGQGQGGEGGGDEEHVHSSTNIAGFLYVVKVEPELNTVTVLSPCPGALPSSHFLVGSIRWME